MKTKSNLIVRSLFALGMLATTPTLGAFHEVELHSTQAVLAFSDESSMDIAGNYLKFLNDSWQIQFGAAYRKDGDLMTRTGIGIGGVYNFGAPDHNEKMYIKPQLTYNSVDIYGNSQSVMYLSGVFGRRFPIFKNDQYTINYTPSIGLSIPVTNTDEFDTVVTVSLIGLSLVFK